MKRHTSPSRNKQNRGQVFANKQDMEGAATAAQVSEALGLSELKRRTWTIFKCSAKTGEGLHEGMDWLVNVVSGGGGK